MKVSLIITLLFFTYQLHAQEQPEPEKFQKVEVQPEFPGGMAKFYQKYINRNLRYPGDAVKNGIEGKVMVKFVIDESGEIIDSSVEVYESIHPSLDEEAVRLIKESPKWKPGRISPNGEAVKVRMMLPITFKLG